MSTGGCEMDRIKFIHHKGAEILLLDFSDCKADDVHPLVEQAKSVIASRPHRSLLTLANVTNTRFDDSVNQRMKDFTLHNKPYVRAAAVVGVTGIKKIIFEAILLFSQRNMQSFDTVERARDWLISQ